MTRLRTLCTLHPAPGVELAPGTEFDPALYGLEEEEADGLVLRKFVEIVEGDPVAVEEEPVAAPVTEARDESSSVTSESVVVTDDDRSRPQEIVDAIDLLEDGDFGADGTPKMKPLAAVLGYRPTKVELEAALALRETLF